MREYEIYLPTTDNEGRPVDEKVLADIKVKLTKTFGGYTHLRNRNDGAWSFGGVMFHDEVTILRVLDDGTSRFDWQQLKAELESTLRQESVLIVVRTIETL